MHNNLGLLTLLLATFAVGCAPASPIHSMGGADPVLQSVEEESLKLCGEIGSFRYRADENTIIFAKTGSASVFYNLDKARKDNGASVLVSSNELYTDYEQLPETANILHIQTTEYGVVHGEVRVVSKTAVQQMKNTPVGNELDYDYEAKEMEKLCAFSFATAGLEIDPDLGSSLATQEEIDALSSVE